MKHSLIKLRQEASKAYYSGNPILSNEEYDALFEDSGGVGSGESGDFPHLKPMYSLKKWYPQDDPNFPLEGYEVVTTPKYDGAAVSLLLFEGKLVRGLTRGDGIKGKDITDKLNSKLTINIPDKNLIQITGEVVTTKDVQNARNFSAGALSLKSIEEFNLRCEEGGLTFVAYNIEQVNGKYTTYYTWDMEMLQEWGFITVLDTDKLSNAPTDGKVHRINDNNVFYSLGFTAKHPRGSCAEKYRDTPVVTKLLDVIWQTGKSGKVTPVAILEPIVIDDATISRATLNNMAYIEALNLEIGCDVKVIRAGKIIPCIVGRA